MTTVDLPLLPLGLGTDRSSERGVECPGDLPAASDPDLVARARAAKERLGERVFVLGHHYQRDEVIAFADVTGDSFKLARDAAARPDGGVHRLLRRALHGRVGRHPHLAGAEGRAARPGRRLLDGRHGPARPGRGRLGRAHRRGRRRRRRTDHLHELLGRHQGVLRPPRRRRVHLVQRPGSPGVGLRAEGAGHQGAVPARPAPRPQHRRARPGPVARRLRGLEPAASRRRASRPTGCATPG